MGQYISKDALVAEADRRLDELYNLLPNASDVENGTITISEACNTGKYMALESFRDYVDTLEVKEVQEEPVSEEFEKALAEEWQGYVDRGAATVDALEDNTQELAFAKGFYRGANWQKEQMIAKAVDAHCFGFQGAALFSFKLPSDNYLVGSEVKVIVIKEDEL
jgi:hypothetical protein